MKGGVNSDIKAELIQELTVFALRIFPDE